MLRETELFLGEVVREDRSILDLVDADFTYVNRVLARHYGIEDQVPKGEGRRDEFVRVTFPDRRRGGLMTQASVLTATSNPTRTSPVKRGRWVLEQILGTPPPPPPPNVPELETQHELKGTLRQRMEQHRANPSCANCHQQMDATTEQNKPIDATGQYLDKTGSLRKFTGAGQLGEFLATAEEPQTAIVMQLFHHTVKQPILAYGLSVPEELRTAYVTDGYDMRKLMARSAALAALGTKKPVEPNKSPAVAARSENDRR